MTATTIEVVEDQPGDVATPARTAQGTPRWPRPVLVAGLAALAVPFIAAGYVAITGAWLPPSDHALIVMHIRDVGGPDTPLLGAYSRLGWNHPGPLAFWLLALPYRLSGASSTGVLIGILAVNAAAVAGCLVLARRRGGVVLTVLVGLALAAMTRGLGAAFAFHTWNPDLPVYPTAFLILATWSVIEGDLRLVPLVVAVSCFAWQLHLGYLPVVGGLTAIALIGAAVHLVRARRRPADGAARPWLLIGATAVTAAVCLAPLVVEQLTTRPGNLRQILASFRYSREQVAGPGRALKVAALHLSPLGTWITGDDPAEPFTGWARGGHPALLVLPVLAVAGAGWLAWRARATGAVRFLGVTSASAGFAVVAVARTTGESYNYLFNWFRPVSALLWASVLWALWCAARAWAPVRARDSRALRTAALAAAAVAMLALSVSALGNGVGLEFQEDGSSIGVRALAPGTLAAVAGQERVYLRAVGGWCAGELGNGLALQMIEHGTEVVVTPELGYVFGQHRVRRNVAPTVELWCGPVAKDAIADQPTRPVAATSILTDAEEAELVALQDEFRRQLRAAGREDLVRAVDSPALAHVARLEPPPVAFDPARLDRFSDLMGRAQASAAVFYRPFGPNQP